MPRHTPQDGYPTVTARRNPGARAAVAGLIALSCAGLLASPALASARTPAPQAQGKSVAFTGRYKGTASLLIDNGSVTIQSVPGQGSGTLVGASTVTGSGTSSAAAQCDPFTGSGHISGAAATIDFKVTSSSAQGCSNGESGPITVTFHGTAKADGGSGKAAGARGSVSFKGTLQLGGTSGSQTGSYTVTLTGNLTVK